MNPDLDGHITALIVSFKHLLEFLERKGTLPFAEREKMLDGIRFELEHIPALQGDALGDAKRTLGHLWNPAIRP
jgi:hypothetical protein